MRTPKIGAILLVGCAVLYASIQPTLNERFGLNLPSIRSISGENVSVDDESAKGAQRSADRSPSLAEAADSATDAGNEPSTDATIKSSSGDKTDKASKAEKSASRKTNSDRPLQPAPRPPPKAAAKPVETSDAELRYGLLKEISGENYVSPAGLLYAPGSREGHRLEHLKRHTVDDPGRPGKHGVFDGGMEGALKTIDGAYDRALKGQRTTTKQDRNRTVYTVDMGKRVGYVGGREGGERRKPMARRVTIVVEGKRFITAYPL